MEQIDYSLGTKVRKWKRHKRNIHVFSPSFSIFNFQLVIWLLISGFILSFGMAYSQNRCYDIGLEDGIKQYRSGQTAMGSKNYTQAIKAFKVAKDRFESTKEDCPGAVVATLNEWINKCNTAIQKAEKEKSFREKYDFVGNFWGWFARVKLNGKWGYIDKTGKEITPLKYDDVEMDFSESLAWVELNGKYGYINKTGKEVIPLKYDWADSFSENVACVRLNGKYGCIDNTGKEITPLKYDNLIWGFSEGLACVKLNGKWGYIDKTGKEVIPLKYDDVGLFSKGLAYVKFNGKYFYINKNGECVKDCQ
jgi:hypothetical protein